MIFTKLMAGSLAIAALIQAAINFTGIGQDEAAQLVGKILGAQ